MKRLLLIMLSVCSLLPLSAQEDAAVKAERRIYLWDVTLSMQGRAKGCPNIWESVKNAMCDEIRKITDEKTEVVILPFQHRAISEDVYRAEATTEGKDKLIKYIDNYQIPRLWDKNAGSEAQSGKGNTTMTALYSPLKYCVDNILTSDKRNILELMTDGVSDDAEDQAAFDRFILSDEFCSMANDNDVLMFFVALTQQAKYSKAEDVKCKRIVVTPPGNELSHLALTPQVEKVLNTYDDYDDPISLMFSSTSANPVRDGYKVRVYSSENPYMHIDQIVEVGADYSIVLNPLYLLSTEEMNMLLAQGESGEICLMYEMAPGMDEYPFLMNVINSGVTRIKMINTRQKKVTLRWE